MFKKMLVAPLLAAVAVAAAPTAGAQVVQCELSGGILVVVALNGPVVLCSADTSTQDPVQLGPLNLTPKLFTPAPEEP